MCADASACAHVRMHGCVYTCAYVCTRVHVCAYLHVVSNCFIFLSRLLNLCVGGGRACVCVCESVHVCALYYGVASVPYSHIRKPCDFFAHKKHVPLCAAFTLVCTGYCIAELY